MATGRSFGCILIPYGVIPPDAGPARDSYLEVSGLKQLEIASEEYKSAMRFLGTQVENIPLLPNPLKRVSVTERRRLQVHNRVGWTLFRNRLDVATLSYIEAHIRRSESAAVSALNYLEDHALERTAHLAIHQAAFIRSGLFGCPIVRKDGGLWSDCSANISHIRQGMSAGLSSEFSCSVCGERLEDCDHLMGELYLQKAQKTPSGDCSLCFEKVCQHELGSEYEVAARGIGIKMQIHEGSLVSRPHFPLARITEIELDLDLDPEDRLYPHSLTGNLVCDTCLGPCSGYRSFP